MKRFVVSGGMGVLLASTAWAAEKTASTPVETQLAASVLRLAGAFIFVIALFFVAVWAMRNSQRFLTRKTGAAKLNVLEMRSLGNRNALYVIGYEQQRFLVSSSTTGVQLVAHLPQAEAAADTATPAPVSFGEALTQVLGRKS